ncbi:MAG: DegT/DnrJ/EryC1/StrS family aminotransferase, partial [bacterium]
YHHVYNQYTVQVKADRDAFIRHLGARGVGSRIYYPQLIPHSPAYRRLGYGGSFPVAEQLTKQVVSLPVHPALSSDDIDWIIESVRQFPHRERV